MPKLQGRSKRGRLIEFPRVTRAKIAKPPSDLASRIRGLYGRVARRLHVDPSYVSRVARGERQSKLVEVALRRELKKIVQGFRQQRRRFARRKPGR